MMRTRIVCTLGPASDDEGVLRAMIRAGMDVARINFSHGSQDDHRRRIALVRRLADEEGAQVAVMGDLQGPKFRLGDLPPAGVPLAPEQPLRLSAARPYAAGPEGLVVPMPHPEFIDALRAGQRLLVDDGALVLRVVERASGGEAECRAVEGGLLASRKGVSAPGASLALSAITPKDRDDLSFAVAQSIDALALSFARRADDVRELRSLVSGLGGDQLLVAKIEKPEAVDDLPDILRAADAVMVARGDLGVEAPAEEVPFYQKTIIHSCLRAGVPVITATQMLQSMIESPSPTRAEASDVANAVLDGTDAVMLSGETAVGRHPVEAVEAMARIATRAEAHPWTGINTCPDDRPDPSLPQPDVTTGAVTCAAVDMAAAVQARAIVCTTVTGRTARMIARHRPGLPILALTPNERTRRFTAFMWGVAGERVPVLQDTEQIIQMAEQLAVSHGYARRGERIVIVASHPFGAGTGTINLVKVHQVA
jgi:pyruvate kinase